MSDTIERIKKQVESSPILIYMKGTPDFPQCGFSARAVEILHSTGFSFDFINIFDEPDIRSQLPAYSNWPTFPQIFVGGQFIGGGDILFEMSESNELVPLIKETLGA